MTVQYNADDTPTVDPGLTIARALLIDSFKQSDFELRIKQFKNAKRELECDNFFKSIIDEMISV